MQNNIKFIIKKKKKSYIIIIYDIKLKSSYNFELKIIFKDQLLTYKYILLFLIKLGLINVYL